MVNLPREVMESSSLEIFKTQQDMALRNLVYLQRRPCFGQELDQIISRGPFQPKLVFNYMTRFCSPLQPCHADRQLNLIMMPV